MAGLSQEVWRHVVEPLGTVSALLPVRCAAKLCHRACAPVLLGTLCGRLRSSDWAARLRALHHLVELVAPGCDGGDNTAAMAVAALLADEDGRVRETAVNTLGRLAGEGDALLVMEVADHIDSASPFVRTAASAALALVAAKAGNQTTAAAAASAFLEHADGGVRATAVETLGRITREGDAETARLLVARLADGQVAVRHAALQALRRVAAKGDAGATTGFVTCLAADGEAGVRQAAAVALAHAAERGHAPVVAALVKGLQDSAWGVRKACAESLAIAAVQGDKAVVAALVARQKPPDPHSLVRRAVDEAHARIAKGPRGAARR